MVKKIFRLLKKVRRNTNFEYINHCKLPIDDKLVLLEGGQGGNINGNMFSMLKELNTNPRWKDYKTAFVVTNATAEKAKQRMSFYGFNNTTLVTRDTNSYSKLLATAKYLLTDNSFPTYFNKRDGQIYMNTWHGTPLKTLGKATEAGYGSLANIQKNYLMSDYALFPNEFTRNVFLRDYSLKNIFSGKSFIANYPRNYIFYDKNAGIDMKKTLGFEGKKVYAYMPTWRDASTRKLKEQQIEQTYAILKEFDKKLDDNSVLLVNLHFLLASEIDCSELKNVKYFPADYDTYEVLNACDGLITDYSSVFFDYAATGKKIVLYAYDKAEYLDSRGVYMPFENLPFPIVETVDDVISKMNSEIDIPLDFIEEYCSNGWKNSCEKLFALMVNGEEDGITLESHMAKKQCLIYAGSLPKVYHAGMKQYIKDNPEYSYAISYRKKLSTGKKEALDDMGDDVSTLGLVSAFQFTLFDLFVVLFSRFFGIVKSNKTADEFFEREARRIFHGLTPAKVIDFSCNNPIMAGIICKLSGEKAYIVHGDYFCVKSRSQKNIDYSRRYEAARGFSEINLFETDNALYFSEENDGIAHASFRKYSRMNNILPLYFNVGPKLKCISLFSFRSPYKTRLSDMYIEIADNKYDAHFLSPKKKLSKKHFGFYSFTVPLEDVVNLPAINRVYMCYKNKYNLTVKCHAKYFSPLGRHFLGLRGPMNIYKPTETVAIFRQSKGNRLNIYVRSLNLTDKLSHRIKQILAYALSLFWHTQKAKKLVVLYEKNSSKYEESASVLFEKLIDDGYKYAYFIVTRDYEFIDCIPEKYRDHIVYKYTFRHYLYFFKSKTFIGTETLTHAIDLKTFNLFALRKVVDKRINYVFLQHGVMYMVSLDSESRGMFKRQKLKGKYRVVVSSDAEAEHFITLGKHHPEDLYISGLPKFDRNTHNADADKIIIMPTWRPWEINTARTDFTQTAYFKMLMKIYNCVPEDLKDKVIILPHPLITNELSKLTDAISEKIVLDARYDDLLKSARLLITDYSSIAYDAFYRGTRVIFYWEEKDFCMQQYGPSTKLMLNEENVYGDYFYSDEGLSQAIVKNYNEPQKQEYIDRYRKIVQFHDGKNTDRLIEFLKNDEII